LGENSPRRVVDVRTGKVVASSFAEAAADPVVSPDGRYAAGDKNGQIVVVWPDGSVVRRLAHCDETPDRRVGLEPATRGLRCHWYSCRPMSRIAARCLCHLTCAYAISECRSMLSGDVLRQGCRSRMDHASIA